VLYVFPVFFTHIAAVPFAFRAYLSLVMDWKPEALAKAWI